MFLTKFDEATKLWSGADVPPIYNPNINCAHAILNAMKLNGSKVAEVSEERQKKWFKNVEKNRRTVMTSSHIFLFIFF